MCSRVNKIQARKLVKLVKNGLKILDAQIEAKQVESDPTMAKKSAPKPATEKKDPEKTKSATVPSRSKKSETPKVVDLTMDEDDEAPVNNNNEITEKLKVRYLQLCNKSETKFDLETT